MKQYEIQINHNDGHPQSVYIKSDAPSREIEDAILFVKNKENYTFDMVIGTLRALGYKVSIVNLDAEDVFEF